MKEQRRAPTRVGCSIRCKDSVVAEIHPEAMLYMLEHGMLTGRGRDIFVRLLSKGYGELDQKLRDRYDRFLKTQGTEKERVKHQQRLAA